MNLDGVPPDSPLRTGDPLVLDAAVKAQQTFRYLWRELSWESRRIIPGLDLACIKVPFFDDDNPDGIEHMWISDIDFDGTTISGELINEPNDLKSIKEGDNIEVPLNRISDWMYAINGRAYGGYSVNMLRAGMSSLQRREHDRAWGLEFGNPNEIIVYPDTRSKAKGLLSKLLPNGNQPTEDEHPMSISMGPKLIEFLDKNPDQLNHQDEKGWTLLHNESLAGNLTPVEILLKKGADLTIKTNHGMTALVLANCLKWDALAQALKAAEMN